MLPAEDSQQSDYTSSECHEIRRLDLAWRLAFEAFSYPQGRTEADADFCRTMGRFAFAMGVLDDLPKNSVLVAGPVMEWPPVRI